IHKAIQRKTAPNPIGSEAIVLIGPYRCQARCGAGSCGAVLLASEIFASISRQNIRSEPDEEPEKVRGPRQGNEAMFHGSFSIQRFDRVSTNNNAILSRVRANGPKDKRSAGLWKWCTLNTSPAGRPAAGSNRRAHRQNDPSRSEKKYSIRPSGD